MTGPWPWTVCRRELEPRADKTPGRSATHVRALPLTGDDGSPLTSLVWAVDFQRALQARQAARQAEVLERRDRMVKVSPLAGPQLAPCASSGRAWRLWVARTPEGASRANGAPSHCLGCLS